MHRKRKPSLFRAGVFNHQPVENPLLIYGDAFVFLYAKQALCILKEDFLTEVGFESGLFKV